ncbi:MAG: serine hydrolase [Alphaproteobacteria bacterium]|nr:MAG: serine hydrolase [Alphaproteobacteria bacterium]
MSYFPPQHPADWQRSAPEAAGLDPSGLAAATRCAAEHETPWGRDLAQVVERDFNEEPPWNEALGPVRPRGGPNGLVLRGGRIVAEWGDTGQIDLTFSVAKSYLSILAGLAFDRGLIRDLHEPVCRTVHDGGFQGPHNAPITWHHLLQQTSEWEGELWGKPDLIDRHRSVGGLAGAGKKGTHRDLQPPGSFWEYNDVRVNRLSLALLRLWRRPLPAVFRELVTDQIGASADWEWHGYRNSYVEIGGERMQSVSGGSHWGGGVFIHARNQARIGLMLLRGGMWRNRRILSEDWLERMRVPCPLNPQYGYLWWLNTDRRWLPSASASSYFASGAGGNLTWIDPENDIVAVLRWIDPAARDAFIRLVMTAIRQ